MGRNWLQEISLNWKEIFGLGHTAPVNPSTILDVLEKHKKLFKKWLCSEAVSPQLRLARFLLTYRNTPHTVTERTPAELFLKRQPHIRLTLLKPNTSAVVLKHQRQQKKAHDTPFQKLRSLRMTEGHCAQLQASTSCLGSRCDSAQARTSHIPSESRRSKCESACGSFAVI